MEKWLQISLHLDLGAVLSGVASVLLAVAALKRELRKRSFGRVPSAPERSQLGERLASGPNEDESGFPL